MHQKRGNHGMWAVERAGSLKKEVSGSLLVSRGLVTRGGGRSRPQSWLQLTTSEQTCKQRQDKECPHQWKDK